MPVKLRLECDVLISYKHPRRGVRRLFSTTEITSSHGLHLSLQMHCPRNRKNPSCIGATARGSGSTMTILQTENPLLISGSSLNLNGLNELLWVIPGRMEVLSIISF